MTRADQRRLYLVGVLILAANALDLFSTYLISPNLANEWNILQRQFALGWTGLIGAKLIGISIAFVGYSFYLRHRGRLYPGVDIGFSGFCRHLSFGPTRQTDILSRNDSTLRLGVNLGYFWAGMQALVIWVAIDNLLLGYGISAPLRQQSELGYHMLQSWAIAGLVLARFYIGNYRRNQILVEAVGEQAIVGSPPQTSRSAAVEMAL